MNRKKFAISLIILFTVAAVALTSLLVAVLLKGNNFNFSFDFSNNNMTLIDEASVDSIDKVYLNLYSTDVEIKQSTDDKIKIEYYSNRDNNPKVEVNDTTIFVDETNYNVSCIGFCNQRRKVVVYLTSSYEGKIDINTKSGDVKSEVNIISSSINTSSGDVRLSAAENADIKTSSGDVFISEANKSLSVKTSSGDVVIDTLNITESSEIVTSSGDVNIKNNVSDCYVDYKTSSGDQRINKSNRKSDIILKVVTSSGDITVN